MMIVDAGRESGLKLAGSDRLADSGGTLSEGCRSAVGEVAYMDAPPDMLPGCLKTSARNCGEVVVGLKGPLEYIDD